MNLPDALKKAQKTNHALRCTEWPDGRFVYHGMDNQLRWDGGTKLLTLSIALLLSTTWETSSLHPYQIQR